MNKKTSKTKNFTILKTDVVYKSEKIQINKCKVKLPNGNIALWDEEVMPDFFFGVPIVDDSVLMTKEWRLGPNALLTQFTGSRCISNDFNSNLGELKREMHEELGILGGTYKKLISYANGVRMTGSRSYFAITDFKISKPKRDKNEIQKTYKFPIKGLFNELKDNHTVTGDALLIAKLIEEGYLG